jgi:1,4-alpha-glucan branching enzyme
MSRDPIGSFCLVLHSHVPWVLHHGSWPVGEEWLYQVWAESYLPLTTWLSTLADAGRQNLLTVGITPILAAQWDNDYALHEFYTWLGDWQVRAVQSATRPDPVARDHAGYEFRRACAARASFETEWVGGGSAPWRRLWDAGVVDLLGGPATHPFLPLLDPWSIDTSLQVGLTDSTLRLGRRPRGLWAPECGYRPELLTHYARHGVEHLVVDVRQPPGSPTGSSVLTLSDSDIVGFVRDQDLTAAVWSADGYPSGPWYRDFHSFDGFAGFRSNRITSVDASAQDKQPYRPEAAMAAVTADADDFVSRVVATLTAQRDAGQRRPIVTAAFDTELFGHWWHEGPAFLAAVFDRLEPAGIQPTTLQQARADGSHPPRVDPPASAWTEDGTWRTWQADSVRDIQESQRQSVATARQALSERAKRPSTWGRDPVADQLLRETLLTTASDWAFMVSHDTAAAYARDRAAGHAAAVDTLAGHIRNGDAHRAAVVAATQRDVDGPFGRLDARGLR